MTTKLLAVDDSKTMRKVLEITFAGNTFDSTIVGSAEEAMASLRAHPPQLVVIDGHLAGQSGYDLCQRIKAEAPDVKVLLLSSKQRPFDASRASSAGVDDHFDKPFDSTKFLDKLGQMQLNAPAPVARPAVASATPPMPVVAPVAAVAPFAAAAPVAAVAPVAAEPVAAVPLAAPAASRPAAPPLSPAAEPTVASISGPRSLDAPSKPQVPQPVAAQPAAAPSFGATSKANSLGGGTYGRTASTPTTQSAPQPVAGSMGAATSVGKVAHAAVNGSMGDKLAQLGLTADQVQGVLTLSREVVEQVVWEVVPQLAETLIKEEIARLTAE